MANYPYLDFGTWESYIPNAENKNQGATTICRMQRSNAFARSGSFSGKGTYLNPPPNPVNWGGPNFYFDLIQLGDGRNVMGLGTGGALGGRSFKLSVWVYIPSGAPIASNDAHVYIGPYVTNWLGGPGTPILPSVISRTSKTVAECLDVWTLFEYEFTAGTNTEGLNGITYVSIYVVDSATDPNDLPNNPLLPHLFTGNMIVNGEIYIDDGLFDELLPCTLAFGSPAFTKSNETVTGANDGSIALNATSSHTMEYSLDNATWQLSNIFTGLAPGTYTGYVRDTNPIGCAINVGGIIISPGSGPGPGPGCDLVFDLPAYEKTDESAPGANDGVITGHAISSFDIEYSIDDATWQISNVFSGLPPENYTLYARDNNPAGCQISIANVIVLPYAAPGALQINGMPLNDNNFFTWYQTSGELGFSSIECTNPNWDLANPYRRKGIKRRHAPIVALNEEFAFYINWDDAFINPDFAEFRLDLMSNTAIVQQGIAPLSRDLFADGITYNIYAAVTIAGALPGIYYLAIRNNTTNAILYVSNAIEIMTLENAKIWSTKLQYRCSADIYKYRYKSVPQFLHKLRLRFYKIDQDSEGELTQYRSASKGRLRDVAAELDRLHVFECYWFDDLANNAMEIFQVHDFILLTYKNKDHFFLPKSLYKADRVPSRNLAKGKVELYEQDFSTANRFGSLENLTIIGSSDPALLITGGKRLKIH